jgi:hypothetical protein
MSGRPIQGGRSSMLNTLSTIDEVTACGWTPACGQTTSALRQRATRK